MRLVKPASDFAQGKIQAADKRLKEWGLRGGCFSPSVGACGSGGRPVGFILWFRGWSRVRSDRPGLGAGRFYSLDGGFEHEKRLDPLRLPLPQILLALFETG